MGRIILEPQSTVSTSSFTGLPATGLTILHTNIDEVVDSLPTFPATPPGDGDVSYCQATSSPATLRFAFSAPVEAGDQTHYLIAYPEMGYRYTVSPTPLTYTNTFKIYKDGGLIATKAISQSNGTNWVQIDDPEGVLGPVLREPIEYTKADAESSAWELEVISEADQSIRITALQLAFNTGYVETVQGGVKLGGEADTGPERTAKVGVKIGGAIPVIFDEQPLGGVQVAPTSSVKDFNDANPFHEGGILVGGSAIDVLFSKKGFLRKTFDISKDIVLTYSGGKLNDTPISSLGGEASPVLIETGINNLFDDVTPREADDGLTDYRCFYVFNQHEDETIFNIKSWISFEVEKGSDVRLGIESRDELQSVILDKVPTSGFFTIRYEASNPLGFAPVTVQVPQGTFTPEEFLNQFGQNFQDALRLNPDLRDVIVNTSTFGTGILFEVLFEKLDGKRQQENLVVGDNSLSPTTIIFVRKVVRGAPINSIASAINIDVTPPGGVVFSVPSSDFPFVIPKLREGEGFHLWVERTTAPDDDPIANDGFALGLSLEPIEPVEVG